MLQNLFSVDYEHLLLAEILSQTGRPLLYSKLTAEVLLLVPNFFSEFRFFLCSSLFSFFKFLLYIIFGSHFDVPFFLSRFELWIPSLKWNNKNVVALFYSG